jgi:hypothetical protein
VPKFKSVNSDSPFILREQQAATNGFSAEQR